MTLLRHKTLISDDRILNVGATKKKKEIHIHKCEAAEDKQAKPTLDFSSKNTPKMATFRFEL